MFWWDTLVCMCGAKKVQCGMSCLAKHGGAYFLALYVPFKDPIAAPGPYEPQFGIVPTPTYFAYYFSKTQWMVTIETRKHHKL